MLDLVPRTPPPDADFDLRLVDDTLLGRRTSQLLVGMQSDAAGEEATDTAARVRELTLGAGAVRLWVSQQDGWIVHRMDGPEDAVATLSRRIERDPRLQGVRRLATSPLDEACTALPDGWWLHGGRDGSSRGQVAACLRQAASTPGSTQHLWTRLCLPRPSDAADDAEPPPPLVVLCHRARDVAALATELEQAVGRSTARLRLLTIGRPDRPVSTVSNLGVIDRRGPGGNVWPPMLVGAVGDASLLAPLALDARTVIAPIDALGHGGAATHDPWEPWGAATLIGLSTHMDDHRRLIRQAGQLGRTYRVADVDNTDLRALVRRILTAWASAAGFATTR